MVIDVFDPQKQRYCFSVELFFSPLRPPSNLTGHPAISTKYNYIISKRIRFKIFFLLFRNGYIPKHHSLLSVIILMDKLLNNLKFSSNISGFLCFHSSQITKYVSLLEEKYSQITPHSPHFNSTNLSLE